MKEMNSGPAPVSYESPSIEFGGYEPLSLLMQSGSDLTAGSMSEGIDTKDNDFFI